MEIVRLIKKPVSGEGGSVGDLSQGLHTPLIEEAWRVLNDGFEKGDLGSLVVADENYSAKILEYWSRKFRVFMGVVGIENGADINKFMNQPIRVGEETAIFKPAGPDSLEMTRSSMEGLDTVHLFSGGSDRGIGVSIDTRIGDESSKTSKQLHGVYPLRYSVQISGGEFYSFSKEVNFWNGRARVSRTQELFLGSLRG